MMSSSQSQEKISNLDNQIVTSPLQDIEFKYKFEEDEILSPPPLPIKTRSKKFESQRSLYDNVDAESIENNNNSSLLTVATTSSSNSSLASSSTITSFSNAFSHDNSFKFHQHSTSAKNKYFSCIEPRMQISHGDDANENEDRPPLPPKKNKHSECAVMSERFFKHLEKNFRIF